MSNRPILAPLVLGLALSGLLAACGSDKSADNAYQAVPTPAPSERGGGSIFGSGGIPLLDSEVGQPVPPQLGVGVNAFLWRASLDTVSFMPIASADPFGGVIITDWFAPPETPAERFKINIFILDRQLRADGIRAAVFRQTQTSDGRWVDAPVEKKTAGDFENAILTRARQLRVTSASTTAQN
jgi:hypothetical protein